jgi:hypothetical protein
MSGDPDEKDERESAAASRPLSSAAERRGETELERVDRNLEELLAELRVALPGVQVLFAFLLILPFNQRFGEVSQTEKWIYLFTLTCTAFASVLLIAPTMQHRLQFRRGAKERIMRHSQRLTIAGLGFLAAGMLGASVLVASFVFGAGVAIALGTVLLAAFAIAWVVVPLSGRRNSGDGM